MSVLIDIAGEDAHNFLTEMLPLFYDDAKSLLEALHPAILNEDAAAVRQAAHTLKGTSATLGMTRLSSLCLELETMGRARDLSGAEDKFEEIVGEYERIKEATVIRQAAGFLM